AAVVHLGDVKSRLKQNPRRVESFQLGEVLTRRADVDEHDIRQSLRVARPASQIRGDRFTRLAERAREHQQDISLLSKRLQRARAPGERWKLEFRSGCSNPKTNAYGMLLGGRDVLGWS